MTHDVDVAAWATEYARQGLRVFPCKPRDKVPATAHGMHDATTDVSTIRAWFAEDRNVAIACEPSGLLVIDVDTIAGHGVDGPATLADLEAEFGPLPVTVTAETPTGGIHYFYKAPAGPVSGSLGPGIDVKRNGYVMAAPSVHPSGGTYRWRADLAPGEVAFAELPPEWIERARPSVPPPPPPPIRIVDPSEGDFYDALAGLDQRRVLECISGTTLVNGEALTFKRTPRGKYTIVVDGKPTSNFIDERGRIGARNVAGKDGGPLASTWLRYYGDDDAAIRRGLIEHVPELARFARPANGVSMSHRDVPPRAAVRSAPAVDNAEESSSDRAPPTEHMPEVKRKRWHRGPDVVPEILDRAAEPFVPLALGGDQLVRVRSGGIVTLVGGSGSGKTSLLASLLIEHARDCGPALVVSRELPRDEFIARTIGMQTDAAWEDVLCGRVPQGEMVRVVPQRLVIADRGDASIDVLAEMLAAGRSEHGPDVPILVGVDYIQIIASEQRDMRMRVDDVMTRLDAVARQHRAVLIGLSQSSRPGARALRQGEATGAETTDLGAESAAIERWASVTLAIGAAGPEREDGTRQVAIAIGKARMSGGDREQPATYCGRTGRWRLDGAARPAAEVKAERQAAKADQRSVTMDHAIADLVSSSPEPMTRAAIRERLNAGNDAVSASVRRLLQAGRIVEVARKARRNPSWMLWTRDRAEASGCPLVAGDRLLPTASDCFLTASQDAVTTSSSALVAREEEEVEVVEEDRGSARKQSASAPAHAPEPAVVDELDAGLAIDAWGNQVYP